MCVQLHILTLYGIILSFIFAVYDSCLMTPALERSISVSTNTCVLFSASFKCHMFLLSGSCSCFLLWNSSVNVVGYECTWWHQCICTNVYAMSLGRVAIFRLKCRWKPHPCWQSVLKYRDTSHQFYTFLILPFLLCMMQVEVCQDHTSVGWSQAMY